jgi:hypothetical protein
LGTGGGVSSLLFAVHQRQKFQVLGVGLSASVAVHIFVMMETKAVAFFYVCEHFGSLFWGLWIT